jgi:hypothetical protein
MGALGAVKACAGTASIVAGTFMSDSNESDLLPEEARKCFSKALPAKKHGADTTVGVEHA